MKVLCQQILPLFGGCNRPGRFFVLFVQNSLLLFPGPFVTQSFTCPDCVAQSLICDAELPLVPIVQHRAFLPVQNLVPALSLAVLRHRASPCPDCAAQSFACTDYMTQSFPACSKQGSGTSSSRCCVAQSFTYPDCVAQSFAACSMRGSGFFPSRCYATQSFPCPDCAAQSFACPDCVTQSFSACSKPGSGFFPGCFETQSFPLSRLCGTELCLH